MQKNFLDYFELKKKVQVLEIHNRIQNSLKTAFKVWE